MCETERVMSEMQAFNKQVNAAIVDPGFIVSVRKKLDLGQKEATEIIGGGINAQVKKPCRHNEERGKSVGSKPPGSSSGLLHRHAWEGREWVDIRNYTS